MVRGPNALRAAALLGAGALALHELRYRVGYGHEAGEAAAAHGHGYLSWAAVCVLVLLVGAGFAFATALVRAPRVAGDRSSLFRSWLFASGALSCVYVIQELVEGLLAHGHPGGLAGLLGHGGWTALLLALAIGALVALAFRGADDALALAAPGRAPRLPTLSPLAQPARSMVAPLRPSPIALHLAGRAPPASR